MAKDDISALQKAAGTHADVWLERGPPLVSVPSVAESLRADLLVIGKSPHGTPWGLRTMSMTRFAERHARLPPYRGTLSWWRTGCAL